MIAPSTRKSLTGKPKTASYNPPRHYPFQQYRDLPPFSFQMIRWMLTDSTIRLGLAMRAAPLMQAEFAYKEGMEWKPGLRAERTDVGEFVLKEIRKFWKHELNKMLSAQVWGWSAAEVTYKLSPERKVIIDSTLQRHAQDVRAMTKDGELRGVRFLRTNAKQPPTLKFPKCYWHAYQPESESAYGRSALMGCYSPWADKCLNGGGLDVRRTFMHKDAYGGVDVAYPPGTQDLSDTEVEDPNAKIARDIAENLMSGGITFRPSTTDDQGNEEWQITRSTIPSNPQHILQYPKDLDTEILRGMEIPDDVIKSENTGAWQGKQVPMQAFFTNADRWLADIIRTVCKQIFEPLVLVNFGRAYEFEITTKPLAEQAMEQMGEGEQTPQPIPGQAPPQFMGLEERVGEHVGAAAVLVEAGRKLLDKDPLGLSDDKLQKLDELRQDGESRDECLRRLGLEKWEEMTTVQTDSPHPKDQALLDTANSLGAAMA